MLQLLPDSFAARYNLGVTAFQQGDEEAAIAHYEDALAVDPANPLAAATLNNLGTVYLDRGERDKAIERWQQAVAVSPSQFEARYNLASQYMADDSVNDAIPLLEQAARLAPNHEALHGMLARAYMAVGRDQEAIRALTLVHRLYPSNWLAPLAMADLLARAEQPEQAKPLLEAALETGGDAARAAAAGYPALGPLLPSGAANGAR